MTRFFFITIPFLLFFASAKTQVNAEVNYTYTVFYNYTFQPDKYDSSRKVSEQMLLLTGPDYSHYLSHNRYLTDSAIKIISAEAEQSGSIPVFNAQNRPPRPIINHQVFKIFNTKQYYFHNTIGVQQPCFTDDLPALNWQITDENKTILGYECKKATTEFAGRSYIAWYTTAIPVSDGPYKFYGLPGLILHVNDTQNHYSFTVTSMEQTDKKLSLKKLEGQQVHHFDDLAAYNDYVNKLKNDPALMFQQNLIKVPPEAMEKVVSKIKEDLKTQNNPIELQ